MFIRPCRYVFSFDAVASVSAADTGEDANLRKKLYFLKLMVTDWSLNLTSM
jgi:hypothetical protein